MNLCHVSVVIYVQSFFFCLEFVQRYPENLKKLHIRYTEQHETLTLNRYNVEYRIILQCIMFNSILNVTFLLQVNNKEKVPRRSSVIWLNFLLKGSHHGIPIQHYLMTSHMLCHKKISPMSTFRSKLSKRLCLFLEVLVHFFYSLTKVIL